jgi:DNA-binding NtrC family response regulator
VSRLLVVDDDIQLLFGLEAVLRQKGHIVETASTGKAALSKLSTTSFDAVITDLQMPGQDGLALFHSILKSKPELPVVVLSALASVNAAVEAIKSGASDFLQKPFSSDALDKVIENIFDSAQPRESDNAEVVTVSEMERKLIMTALRKTNGNRTHAAKLLGISLRTLRNKLREYRVEEAWA